MADAGTMTTDGPAPSGGLTGRTAWARNLAAPLRDFLSTETAGAAALLGATVAALVWANSPWSDSYESFWRTVLSISVGDHAIAMDLRGWINQGLMTLFFLVVGLEAKRELDLGQLRERSRFAIPVVAALGGMALPVAIYLAFNAGGAGADGWAAAMSTDTAFALALLGLVAPRGARLRVQLLTLAIADDFVALVIIATAYTDHVSVRPLVIAAVLFVALAVMLRYTTSIRIRRPGFAILLAAIWTALHESGVDPIIAGLASGLLVSAYQPAREDLEQVVERIRSFREQPTPELARSAQRGVASAISPNERVQYALHPWTSFVVAPLFALANAGIHVDSDILSGAVTSPITLGIFFGYVVGKPVGITAATWIASRLRRTPPIVSLPVTFGGGVVGGVGFTVSLLISSIAFSGSRLAEAKLGVLAAATVAALGAWGVFAAIRRLPAPVRARQLSGTAEDLVDLYDDVDPDRDHVRGADDAPVTLVEYGDYECPYCGRAEIVIRELLTSFGDDLRYVWRHLPLADVHPNAQTAAEAAEAAGGQGRFWDMHDCLLDHQDELAPKELPRHAATIGLDVERFTEDLRRRVYAERVADDVHTADASGVAGTPSFFVNGRRYQGAYDLPTLTSVVRAARARAVADSVARKAA